MEFWLNFTQDLYLETMGHMQATFRWLGNIFFARADTTAQITLTTLLDSSFYVSNKEGPLKTEVRGMFCFL